MQITIKCRLSHYLCLQFMEGIYVEHQPSLVVSANVMVGHTALLFALLVVGGFKYGGLTSAASR